MKASRKSTRNVRALHNFYTLHLHISHRGVDTGDVCIGIFHSKLVQHLGTYLESLLEMLHVLLWFFL